MVSFQCYISWKLSHALTLVNRRHAHLFISLNYFLYRFYSIYERIRKKSLLQFKYRQFFITSSSKRMCNKKENGGFYIIKMHWHSVISSNFCPWLSVLRTMYFIGGLIKRFNISPKRKTKYRFLRIFHSNVFQNNFILQKRYGLLTAIFSKQV